MEEKVFDGERYYSPEEYQNVVYPQMKKRAKMAIKKLQNGFQAKFNTEDNLDSWSERLIYDG